ncbi:MAG: hypothetical protein KJN59_11755 [Bacteroidia bacterium]|nr:hypothetical protein [Bacteroidia bacterium]
MSESKKSQYLKYAIGEIFLVVIGILIALQINNWNESRKLEKKETIYLNGLKADLEQSVKALNRVIKKTTRVSKGADTLAGMIKNHGSELSAVQIDSLTSNSSGFTVFMPSEGVINDIIGSGKLDMIQNDGLRSKIASWEADLRMIREFEKLSKNAVDNYTEHSDQYFDLVNEKFGRTLFLEPKREEFLNDNIFTNHLADIYRLSTVLNNLYLDKSSELDSLITIIDSELE